MNMKIFHYSETDLGGGAGISSYRLHRALVARGIDSHFLVSRKFSTDPTVREAFPRRFSNVRRLMRERLDHWPVALYRKRRMDAFLSTARLSWGASALAKREGADLVHLHWINSGFLGLAELRRFRQPMLWSIKDMWPFTGGCHYTDGCTRFTQACGQCPLLGAGHEIDLTRRQYRRKLGVYQRVGFHYVCLSQHSLEVARTSPLLHHHEGHFLPIGVNLDRFQPIEQAIARRILGLPAAGFLVAFGAMQLDDTRKGGDLAVAAAGLLANRVSPDLLAFTTFGGGQMPARFGPYRVHHLGLLRDEHTTALALAAVDAALIPSREDTGPNLTIEALACGTPVVGFPVGATRDLVQTGRNGFLATPYSAESLADGLGWAVSHHGNRSVRLAARESVKIQHDGAKQAGRYVELYQRMIAAGA